jgi:hypothetical protein
LLVPESDYEIAGINLGSDREFEGTIPLSTVWDFFLKKSK